MKEVISQFLLCLVLLLCASMSAVSQTLMTGCVASKSVEAERGKPLIYGESYQVPALHIQLREKATGTVLTATTVHVRYYWKWLQYPYPEHEWGAWVDADELIDCSTDVRGQLTAPTLNVKARGWYDGKFAHFPWSQKPPFDRVEIVIDRVSDSPRVIIKKKDELVKYLHSLGVVELSDEAPKVTFTQLPSP